jgi:hypothetical protein
MECPPAFYGDLTIYKAQSPLDGNFIPRFSGTKTRSGGELSLIPGLLRLGKSKRRAKKQGDDGQQASFHKIAPENKNRQKKKRAGAPAVQWSETGPQAPVVYYERYIPKTGKPINTR